MGKIPAAVSLLFVVATWSVTAQTPASDPQPSFEVASIKPNNGAEQGIGGRGFGRGRWDRTNAPLSLLITEAFGIRDEQLVGLPGWARSDRFDVDARTQSVTDITRLNQAAVHAMMQALLRERFSLVSHAETRDVPTYDVVLVRSDGALGRDLHATEHTCNGVTAAQRAEALRNVAPGTMFCSWQFRPNEGVLTGDGQRLDALLTNFPFLLGRPVFDKTGLTAPMTWMLKWRVEGVASDAPELPVALQEQLGLKLVSSHGPLDFIVIDSVSRPTPD
jgi:uncharacterized protein (TIGR03435 family)